MHRRHHAECRKYIEKDRSSSAGSRRSGGVADRGERSDLRGIKDRYEVPPRELPGRRPQGPSTSRIATHGSFLPTRPSTSWTGGSRVKLRDAAALGEAPVLAEDRVVVDRSEPLRPWGFFRDKWPGENLHIVREHWDMGGPGPTRSRRRHRRRGVALDSIPIAAVKGRGRPAPPDGGGLHRRIVSRTAPSAPWRAIRQTRAGLKGWPPGGLVHLPGPTGVRKTEVARSLPPSFSGRRTLVRFDMSEYMEALVSSSSARPRGTWATRRGASSPSASSATPTRWCSSTRSRRPTPTCSTCCSRCSRTATSRTASATPSTSRTPSSS